MRSFSVFKISPEHQGLTVEAYLKQILHYSGRKLQKLTRKKGILLNNKPVFLQRNLSAADTLSILILEDASYGVQPEKGSITILYEDECLLVLDKPARQLVHPAGRTNSGTLANYLAFHFKERNVVAAIRPLHRLDRDTSGCVIFAKNAESQSKLEQQLKAGQLKRTYQALVKGFIEPPIGTINAAIGAHPQHPNRRTITPTGEQAITHYKVLEKYNNASLVELNLETGRTHQIRLHLAYLGNPILGDGMYGVRSPLIARQALHASSVTFYHLKEKRQLTVDAPLPGDFTQAIGNLRQAGFC
ncbi:MAG: RluA family pseudouridine synthase [Veillonellaceae bacterium]|jgi:23S rRNA pseudouridine1911/1915/1917 synthase|nr:RluA family pseudouridine synthase [Veillonellaceae bacterium]